MKQKKLGTNGPSVSAMALGCMGMSEFYGSTDEQESLATLDLALEQGIHFWDTADAYGPHHNEELLAKALKGRRENVFLATKFGILRDRDDAHKRGINGHPDYVKQAVEGSLKRLNTDHIDLYYQHRMDPNVPVEDTVGAMADLVKAGKVRYLGLSEVSVETLERAHKVHPISAVQSEYSLWSREPEQGILAACEQLGCAFLAYSPLGRGFLSGAIRSIDDFAEDDFRRFLPRFQGENFVRNLQLVNTVKALAEQKGILPSQLALAWLMAKADFIIPLFGTKRRRYLEENQQAISVQLTQREIAEIEAAFPIEKVKGERYTKDSMKLLPQ